MTGEDMLLRAADVVAGRRASYGDPVQAMEAVAKRWSVTLGRPVTAAQVVMCLIDLKLARLAHDPSYEDGWLDASAYAAIGAEIVLGGRTVPKRNANPARRSVQGGGP
jgi:hypothetical protein